MRSARGASSSSATLGDLDAQPRRIGTRIVDHPQQASAKFSEWKWRGER